MRRPGPGRPALAHANALSLDGYDDWRLPNINEFESLVDAAAADAATWLNGQGFSGIITGTLSRYWTSTTLLQRHEHRGDRVPVRRQHRVKTRRRSAATTRCPSGERPWPRRRCRGRAGRRWLSQAMTETCKQGSARPVPRFSDHLDGTVTDALDRPHVDGRRQCTGPRRVRPRG